MAGTVTWVGLDDQARSTTATTHAHLTNPTPNQIRRSCAPPWTPSRRSPASRAPRTSSVYLPLPCLARIGGLHTVGIDGPCGPSFLPGGSSPRVTGLTNGPRGNCTAHETHARLFASRPANATGEGVGEVVALGDRVAGSTRLQAVHSAAIGSSWCWPLPAAVSSGQRGR